MGRPLKLVWTVEALADLKRFEAFLRANYPSLSRTVASALLSRAELLVEYPELGRRLPQRPTDRQLVVKALNASYVIHYRVDAGQIIILRVFHGREHRPPET